MKKRAIFILTTALLGFTFNDLAMDAVVAKFPINSANIESTFETVAPVAIRPSFKQILWRTAIITGILLIGKYGLQWLKSNRQEAPQQETPQQETAYLSRILQMVDSTPHILASDLSNHDITCSICLNNTANFEPENQDNHLIICIHPCGHCLHNSCFNEFRNAGVHQNNCPTCRTYFQQTQTIRVVQDAVTNQPTTITPNTQASFAARRINTTENY